MRNTRLIRAAIDDINARMATQAKEQAAMTAQAKEQAALVTAGVAAQTAAQTAYIQRLEALLEKAVTLAPPPPAPSAPVPPPTPVVAAAAAAVPVVVKSIPWSDLIEVVPPIIKGKGSFGVVKIYDWTNRTMRVAVKELNTALLVGHLSASETEALKREATLQVCVCVCV